VVVVVVVIAAATTEITICLPFSAWPHHVGAVHLFKKFCPRKGYEV